MKSTQDCVSGFSSIIFTHYTTIPAAIIITILAFLEQRTQKSNTCNSRPALIVPIHLLDGYEHKFAYAAAFGAVTNDIINLFLENRSIYPFDYPLWAVAMMLQVQAVEVTLTCFPLFACIATRHRLVGSLCGLFYTSLLCGGVITTTYQEYCAVPDTVEMLKVNAIMRSLPVLVCYVYLICKSIYTFSNAIWTKIFTLQESTDTLRPHQIEHVRLMLRGYYRTILKKEESMWDMISYHKIHGFKFPVIIISVVFIIVVVQYQLLLAELFVGAQFDILVQSIADKEFDNKISFFNSTIVFLTPMAVRGMIAVYYTAVGISSAMTFVHVYFFMKVYRKNILRLHSGDRSFMMNDITRPQYLMASSLRFPGYQIAYCLWGTIILLLSLLVLGWVICYGLFFMHANGYLLSFSLSAVQLLSFPATAILVFYLQVLLARYVLLQPRIHNSDKDPPVNVDNRKFYEGFNFFTLFGSLAIGVFSCLMRVLEGTVMGVVMVGRLDKTTFMRDTEAYDKGHLCYMSMLEVDNAHNHPVLRVFCGLLWDRALELRDSRKAAARYRWNRRKYRTFPSIEYGQSERHNDNHTSQPAGSTSLRQTSVFSNPRIIRKWHLAYTILQNPRMKKFRKHALHVEFEIVNGEDNTKPESEQEIVNSEANTKPESEQELTPVHEHQLNLV